MPSYDFTCGKCNKTWNQFLLMEDRESPTKKPCPHCNEKNCVLREWMGTNVALAADATLTPNKATGGAWNELMAKMKSGLPERYAKKLDKPNNMSGRRWKA
jgi:putative FmdB family regulatory protein